MDGASLPPILEEFTLEDIYNGDGCILFTSFPLTQLLLSSLDMGVIKNLKDMYRKFLMDKIIFELEDQLVPISAD